tara:strand:+ start:151 stop:501 length:351 start_codon:yes stop_codon:yes gene_type:complete
MFEFIDDLSTIIDDKKELQELKSKLKKLIRVSSRKPISLWKENCFKYDNEIENKNYDFFVQKKYKRGVETSDILLTIFEKYNIHFSNESIRNKKCIMQYIYNLNKISKIYYMSKTN